MIFQHLSRQTRLFLGFSFLISLAGHLQVNACLNESRVNVRGEQTQDEGYMRLDIVNHHDRQQEYLRRLASYDSSWRISHDLNAYTDYGVMLVYLGRYQEALNVFLAIEKERPEWYATAANLGTTYELLGDNEKALRWIQKAVEYDPDSHRGSEWIHVRILEGKLGRRQINGNGLLGIDFGDDVIPATSRSVAELSTLRNELAFQLEERMSFIKGDDQIVGTLLFELGNIISLTNDGKSAIWFYDEALRYGFRSAVLDKRKQSFTHIPSVVDNDDDGIDDDASVDYLAFGIAGLIILAFVAILVFVMRSRQ